MCPHRAIVNLLTQTNEMLVAYRASVNTHASKHIIFTWFHPLPDISLAEIDDLARRTSYIHSVTYRQGVQVLTHLTSKRKLGIDIRTIHLNCKHISHDTCTNHTCMYSMIHIHHMIHVQITQACIV